MTPTELRDLIRTEKWTSVDVEHSELGTLTLAVEYEPAAREGYRMMPSDCSIYGAYIVDGDSVRDLTQYLAKWAVGALTEIARQQLDEMFGAAHRQARDEARMVHA